MHRKDELALNSWGFSLFTHRKPQVQLLASSDFPSQASVLLPHTGDQFVLPTGIHIFLIAGTAFFQHPPTHFSYPALESTSLQLSVHTAAESAEHLQEYFFSHICKHKHTTVTRCWVAGLGYPKVFLRSAAKPGGEMNALKYRQKKKEKSSSFVSTGERMREGGILKHVFLSPLSTLVWGNTGGLPRGRRRDQYYTRVELDLKWSTHLP